MPRSMITSCGIYDERIRYVSVCDFQSSATVIGCARSPSRCAIATSRNSRRKESLLLSPPQSADVSTEKKNRAMAIVCVSDITKTTRRSSPNRPEEDTLDKHITANCLVQRGAAVAGDKTGGPRPKLGAAHVLHTYMYVYTFDALADRYTYAYDVWRVCMCEDDKMFQCFGDYKKITHADRSRDDDDESVKSLARKNSADCKALLSREVRLYTLSSRRYYTL
ncbi:unnamed protein product [Trichogramma brassicae]|uniref:Uncharacterized protein n=1 Tax=Trichogramma brassicae TaxID=86971 RepID=A0A6H5I3Z9_9HYME|nr:unnamed protein product [Trichogramma brassicae]